VNARFALVFGLLALGCTQEPLTLPLRSLERSGEASFVCVDSEGHGRDINSCPDFDSVENPRRMLALVTQTLRGEVAVVDLSSGSVVDLDPSSPGFSFVPVGANPTDIVSTPGGVASFVGVAEAGKEGIFGIPSSCLRAPAHDLTSWPACRLPAAPAELAITIDPPGPDDDGNPATPAPERASCEAPYSVDTATPGTALAATRSDCAADLALEKAPAGRRKLVVSLPALGGFAVIDAQGILDRKPGSFQNCEIERFIALPTVAPSFDQKVPEDLQGGCDGPTINYGPHTASSVSLPGGIELTDDARLFISDRSAPLVHVYDLSDPCAPQVEPALLPESFEARNRVVTTSAVAVSSQTSDGRRFAYAVDDYDGSVMVFDVTPGSSDRTPIVFPGSPENPFVPPDRIKFSSPAKDVTFALRDAPVPDPLTGVATIGAFCNPDPGLDPANPAAKYRPNSDYSSGASPHNLRGVFGFVMLTDGNIAVIDVDDFDAPCRRPIEPNAAAVEDFRGCAGDPAGVTSFEDASGKRTVSDEQSCNVVERNRPRSGRIMINSSQFGVNAPAIRSYPRLHKSDGSSLPTDQSEDGHKNPKLLAVDFPSPSGGAPVPAAVYIGTDLYSGGSAPDSENKIFSTDPNTADQLSLALILKEPRAFGGDEDVTLTYEGAFASVRNTGFPGFSGAAQPIEFSDQDANFCNRGVEDVDLARERGPDLGVAPENLDAFARQHADYVQITTGLRAEDDKYWNTLSASCGIGTGKSAYLACLQQFGGGEATATTNRDFRILEAYQDHLVIEPRSPGDDEGRSKVTELAYCCLGGGSALSYVIRAGNEWVLLGSVAGFRHNVIADDQATAGKTPFRCIRDCNPRRKLLNSRAFDVSARDCDPAATDCAIGAATDSDYACVLDKTAPLSPDGPLAGCIFQNLSHRFAIYRGSADLAKNRDVFFSWTVTGAFIPLTANLGSQSRAVSPQSISFVPQLGQLAVADGASEGLVLVSLDSVSVSRLFF
jgi:hypothetical protein